MNTTTNAILWKDLIHIPEQRSTFVLKLTEGLDNAKQTIDQYVVTPSLKDHFDSALSIIDTAIRTGQSQGAFLHGSFGSGKSHFMAVLNLLLQNSANARSIEQLTDVVVKHAWMKDRRFLMIPYHMIGAVSMEAAILGGYVDYVEKHHPEARLPGVYLADRIFENADGLRTSIGDENYFKILNGDQPPNAGAATGWGQVVFSWSQQNYDEARNADSKSQLREKLVGDIVRNLLPALRDSARVSSDNQFVGFDEGLSIISRHAKEIGYDGLILFLDELMLWLSNRSADDKFMREEVAKVPKLVESQHSDRLIPIISFIARQRELKEMLGDAMRGDERSHLGLSLEWWQGRFQTITLEDRNLPVIASERLLRPKDQAAREQIRQSFEQFSRTLQKPSKDIMLTTRHDEKDFALVYPFSPALVESLIVLASTLQRDRTALKLMQTLLIQQRDSLKMGEIIPVGDLWDVIADGEEPMDDLMRKMMGTARKLWENRLRPALVRMNDNFDPEIPGANPTPDQRMNFRNDARLVKTLLVAALVPSIEVFEELTIDRLVALNHGSVRTPIRGAERSLALAKLRKLASDVSEISIEDQSNPVIKLRLDDVDIEPLLRLADSADSLDERRRKVKDLLYKWLEVTDSATLRADFSIGWRGAKRTAHVIYGNTRTMPAERLTAEDENWIVIFDYPFDDPGFSPTDDTVALQHYLGRYPRGTNTISWIPSFLNEQGQSLIGRLLKIEDVLARFDNYTINVRPDDRPIARNMLESARRSVELRLSDALKAAYGLISAPNELLDDSNKAPGHIHTLRPGFHPTISLGADFAAALQNILIQALQHQFPRAYRLPDQPIRTRDAQAIFEIIRTAHEDSERRAYVESRTLRNLLGDIAEPLKLGIRGDTHFVATSFWADEIHKQLQRNHNNQTDSPQITVGDLYALLDSDQTPTGLPLILKDLIVLTYAEMEDIFFTRRGQEIDASIGTLRSEDLLERRRLPNEAAWQRACQLGKTIFGITPPRVRNARNVQLLASNIAQKAAPYKQDGRQLADRLVQITTENLNVTADEVATFKRHIIATKMRQLLDATDKSDPSQALEAIAACNIGEHDASALKSNLMAVTNNLLLLNNQSLWPVIRGLADQTNRTEAQNGLLREVKELLAQPEHATPLERIHELHARIIQLTFAAQPPAPEPPRPTPPIVEPTPEPPAPSPPAARPPARQNTVRLNSLSDQTNAVDWLQDQLKSYAGQKVTISIQVEDDE